MKADDSKRGRKAGIRGLKIHEFYGRKQGEICVLHGTFETNSVIVPLSFAYREAAQDHHGFKNYLDKLLGETPEVLSHKAARYIESWAIASGLSSTSWARVVAAKLIWGSINSPLRPYIHANPVIDPHIFTLKLHLDAMLGRLLEMERTEFGDLRQPAVNLPKELMLSYVYKCGYRNSPFGDFAPALVAQWLGMRSVKVAEARAKSDRVPGWDMLLVDGTDHKTVKKHVLRMADYLKVPTTTLL